MSTRTKQKFHTEEELRISFFEKEVLGRDTKFSDPDSVIEHCIRKAHRDMMSAGRFVLKKGSEQRQKALKALLEENRYVFSRDLIRQAQEWFGEEEYIRFKDSTASRFGLAQKFVNMSFKYFYVYRKYLTPKIVIDFTACDCPLDTQVFSKLGYTQTAWSKITETEYETCQILAREKLEECYPDHGFEEIGAMLFDFYAW